MSGRCDTADPFAPLIGDVHIYNYFEVMLCYYLFMKENIDIIIQMVIQQKSVYLSFPEMSIHNGKYCLLNSVNIRKLVNVQPEESS